MTGPTHELIGLTAVAYVVVVKLLGTDVPMTVPVAVVVAAIVGAEFPDIDQASSRLARRLGASGVLVGLVRPFMMGHRNLTHSVVGLVLVGLLMWWLRQFVPAWLRPDLLWQSFLVAYASHVAADWITTQGVPLLWPHQEMFGFPPDSLKRLRVNTGGFEEYLVVVPIVGFLLVSFIVSYREELLRLLT